MFMGDPSRDGGRQVCLLMRDASRQICLYARRSWRWHLDHRRAPPDQRILDTAFRLFYARGIRAVGVDLIIAESGVAKATFYKHFPAKDDLVLAYLDRVDGIWTGQLHAAAAAAGPAPAPTSSSASSTRSAPRCRREGYRGCAFINAAAEAVPGTPVHERTVAHKQAVLAWVQRAGRPRPAPTDPDALARSLTLLLDGGLASGALDADPEAALAARPTPRRMLVTRGGQTVTAGRGGLRRPGDPGVPERRSAGSPARSRPARRTTCRVGGSTTARRRRRRRRRR